MVIAAFLVLLLIISHDNRVEFNDVLLSFLRLYGMNNASLNTESTEPHALKGPYGLLKKNK